MNDIKWAIITGADGGMGTEITRAVAKAGYQVIMAFFNPQKAETVRACLIEETGNPNLEVMALDLASMQSVASFADRILERNLPVSLLMNNAGTMETGLHITVDGFERTVSVNYVGPYLLTRKLIPAMVRGARIVNMVSLLRIQPQSHDDELRRHLRSAGRLLQPSRRCECAAAARCGLEDKLSGHHLYRF